MAHQGPQPAAELHDMFSSSVTRHKVSETLYYDDHFVRASVVAPTDYKQAAKFGTFFENEILLTGSKKYQLLMVLGKGTFGQVLLSWEHNTKEYAAIKVLENNDNIVEEAISEIGFLKKIREADGDRFYLLYYQYGFICKNHYCLVTEALEQSLVTFMEQRKAKLLSLNEIRPILKQLFVALIKLEELQIIHTDLKPENIMFVNTANSPYRIKVVDFGNAISLNEVCKYKVLQTLFYRSPEILLGTPFGHAIDVWSLGCIAAELYLGCILYQGYSPYDQIRLICQTQGLPEKEILGAGTYTSKYFNRYGPSFWTLKSRQQYAVETNRTSSDGCQYKFNSLEDLLNVRPFNDPIWLTSALDDKYEFLDLLKLLLAVNQSSRISPKAAVDHDFITMKCIVQFYDSCSYAKESVDIMENF